MPLTKTCEVCGIPFTIRRYEIDRRKTCSRACHGVRLRRIRQSEIENEFGKPIAALLFDLYHVQKLGVKKIALILKVSNHVIWDWLESLKIEKRDRSSAVILQWVNNQDRKDATRQRIVEAHATGRIDNRGDNNPAKSADVRRKIRESKLGAKNVMYNQFGDKNPNWKGGKITYRGRGWRGIRLQVIRRDNSKCRICGATKPLQVHHITPYRDTQNNSLDNLITLCISCHMQVESGKLPCPSVDNR